jgi:DNA-binding PadR family transcriptional regulator
MKREAMNTLGYILLSLLVREPMTGYDLTTQLKKRFDPFWPISHTQIYPVLAQLETQGFCRHHIVEQHDAMRPNKKVYEMSEEGLVALRQWVVSPTPLVIAQKEFKCTSLAHPTPKFGQRKKPWLHNREPGQIRRGKASNTSFPSSYQALRLNATSI